MPIPDISIIIVNWNTKAFLRECLTSIVQTKQARRIELVVFDNGSTDGSTEMVESDFPQVHLIKSSHNIGFARGNNRAIEMCSGRYIALVNSDVRVLPNCLDQLARYLDENASVGAVGPRILNTDLTLQCSCRHFPSLWNNFCAVSGMARLFKRSSLFSGEHMFYFDHTEPRRVDVLVGCFWMVRRSTFESVGTLDESFFMYSEDVDWCRRCRLRGWDIVFVPFAEAIHHRGRSSECVRVEAAVAQQESLLRYWAKHHSSLERCFFRGLAASGHAIRFAISRASSLSRSVCGRKPVPNAGAANLVCLKILLGGRPTSTLQARNEFEGTD